MSIEQEISGYISDAFQHCYGSIVGPSEILLQPTKKEFEGDYTFVTFPFLKISQQKPEETGEKIGEYLIENSKKIKSFSVVKGFLNITVTDAAWMGVLASLQRDESLGIREKNGRTVMVEFSSPNTNKPLHLGHLRNIFLGYSVSKLYDALGFDVVKVQIINDRGIHISKSMVAWEQFGNGETPDISSLKGDKLVGNYYVLFDKQFKKEVQKFVDDGATREEAEKEAPIMKKAQETLRRWEARDHETYELWKTMNSWVYNGFEESYDRMGVEFDKLYYESDTYLLGKDEVKEGIAKGIFYKKDDGSVWIDLTDEGLDQKLLLRSDGTAVYMTQDIGTAIERFREYQGMEKLVYTVGNEQEYHFKVLFLILKKLGFNWAAGCYHLSYGMVDLPSGKMKSREGTVVDADDLMDEMEKTAKMQTEQLGKIEGFSNEQAKELYKMVGMGALKYFLLKVDPRKKMLFNPEESVQFQGNTGPFIQYTHARISALIRRAESESIEFENHSQDGWPDALLEQERVIIFTISLYTSKIEEAANEYSPSILAQYVFDLAKNFNKLYQEVSIFGADDSRQTSFRLALAQITGRIINSGMGLLGINVPDRM